MRRLRPTLADLDPSAGGGAGLGAPGARALSCRATRRESPWTARLSPPPPRLARLRLFRVPLTPWARDGVCVRPSSAEHGVPARALLCRACVTVTTLSFSVTSSRARAARRSPGPECRGRPRRGFRAFAAAGPVQRPLREAVRGSATEKRRVGGLDVFHATALSCTGA